MKNVENFSSVAIPPARFSARGLRQTRTRRVRDRGAPWAALLVPSPGTPGEGEYEGDFV